MDHNQKTAKTSAIGTWLKWLIPLSIVFLVGLGLILLPLFTGNTSDTILPEERDGMFARMKALAIQETNSLYGDSYVITDSDTEFDEYPNYITGGSVRTLCSAEFSFVNPNDLTDGFLMTVYIDEAEGQFRVEQDGHPVRTVSFADAPKLSEVSERKEDSSNEVYTVQAEILCRRQSVTKEVKSDGFPAITFLELSGMTDGRMKEKASVNGLYNNVYYNNTVGLIGQPLEILFSEDVEDRFCELTYDRELLQGVPERNLTVVYAEEFAFLPVSDMEWNPEQQTLRFPVRREGVYLAVDRYTYGSAVGWDVSDYAYEKDVTAYESDWERRYNTGDIMKLADKKWAKENGPVFHVKTVEQLASVVYYTNVIRGEAELYLESDLNLSGYDWRPMGYDFMTNSSESGHYVIYGNGHTIEGLTIDAADAGSVGLVGYAGSLDVLDLTVSHARIKGKSCTGILCGQCHGSKTFLRVQADGTVTGGRYMSSAFVGRGSDGIYEDCTADAIVNGEYVTWFNYEDWVKREYSTDSLMRVFVNQKGQVERSEMPADKSGQYRSLGWVITCEGRRLLNRSAKDEMTLPDWVWEELFEKGKTYQIHLEAYDDEKQAYVIVSGTIDYVNE